MGPELKPEIAHGAGTGGRAGLGREEPQVWIEVDQDSYRDWTSIAELQRLSKTPEGSLHKHMPVFCLSSVSAASSFHTLKDPIKLEDQRLPSPY